MNVFDQHRTGEAGGGEAFEQETGEGDAHEVHGWEGNLRIVATSKTKAEGWFVTGSNEPRLPDNIFRLRPVRLDT